MKEQDWKQSQYYQEDFLANHSVQPGSDEARKMTVTSGLKCLELYRKSDPVGSLVKMLVASSTWNSTRCFLTWKLSATPAKRLLFRLVPSIPPTDGTDVLFWPTPTARDYKGSNSMEHLMRPGGKNHTGQLANAVKLFPTPTARDYKSPDLNPESKRPSKKTELPSVVGGQLNPAWVEWLMGFPPGWTDLKASETP